MIDEVAISVFHSLAPSTERKVMKNSFQGFLFCLLFLVLPIIACGSDDEDKAAEAAKQAQATCRAKLMNDLNAAAPYDAYVEVMSVNMHAVVSELGVSSWKSVPGPLDDSLLDVYTNARRLNKSVRVVYGPTGLTDAVRKSVDTHSLGELETKKMYITMAVGCTEAKPGVHKKLDKDCIDDGARECRVTLVSACGDTATPLLDIAFATWDEVGTSKVCYGVHAGGSYAVALPSSEFCQCDTDKKTIRGLYDTARQFLNAALQLRGLDEANADAVSHGIAAAPLSILDISR